MSESPQVKRYLTSTITKLGRRVASQVAEQLKS